MFDSHPQRRDVIIIVIWALWGERNKLIHERKMQTVCSVCTFVNGYACELKAVQDVGPMTRTGQGSCWQPLENM